MIPNEIFAAMETLTKQDLLRICKKLKINTKIKTYDSNGNITSTKNDYCSYDLVKLIKSFFINKNYQIVYHDYVIENYDKPENILITFRNVKQLHGIIKKLYKKNYDIRFKYDKTSYNILSQKWSNGDLVTISQFMNDHFYSNKLNNVNYLSDPNSYEKTKRQILSSINEYLAFKYS